MSKLAQGDAKVNKGGNRRGGVEDQYHTQRSDTERDGDGRRQGGRRREDAGWERPAGLGRPGETEGEGEGGPGLRPGEREGGGEGGRGNCVSLVVSHL